MRNKFSCAVGMKVLFRIQNQAFLKDQFFQWLILFLLLVPGWSHGQNRWETSGYSRYNSTTIIDFPGLKMPVDTSGFDNRLLNAAIFYETNRIRIINKLPELKYDTRLERSAQAHSDSMAVKNFFSHSSDSSRTDDPQRRMEREGIKETSLGENISRGMVLLLNDNEPFYPPSVSGYFKDRVGDSIEMHSYLSLAASLVSGLLKSAQNRSNILNEQYTHLGVGSTLCFDGEGIDRFPYIKCTQNFLAIPVNTVSKSRPRFGRALVQPATSKELEERKERSEARRKMTTRQHEADFEHGYELIAVSKYKAPQPDHQPFEPDHKSVSVKPQRHNKDDYLPFSAEAGLFNKKETAKKVLSDNMPFFAGENGLKKTGSSLKSNLPFAPDPQMLKQMKPIRPKPIDLPFAFNSDQLAKMSHPKTRKEQDLPFEGKHLKTAGQDKTTRRKQQVKQESSVK